MYYIDSPNEAHSHTNSQNYQNIKAPGLGNSRNSLPKHKQCESVSNKWDMFTDDPVSISPEDEEADDVDNQTECIYVTNHSTKCDYNDKNDPENNGAFLDTSKTKNSTHKIELYQNEANGIIRANCPTKCPLERDEFSQLFSQESDISVKSGPSQLPGIRPYVSFDDLETCPVDRGTQGTEGAEDDLVLAGLCGGGDRGSKWNMFTGVVKTMSHNQGKGKRLIGESRGNRNNSPVASCVYNDDKEKYTDTHRAVDSKCEDHNNSLAYGQSKWNQFVNRFSDNKERLTGILNRGNIVSNSGDSVKETKDQTDKGPNVCKTKLKENTADSIVVGCSENKSMFTKPQAASNLFNIQDLGDDDFDL